MIGSSRSKKQLIYKLTRSGKDAILSSRDGYIDSSQIHIAFIANDTVCCFCAKVGEKANNGLSGALADAEF